MHRTLAQLILCLVRRMRALLITAAFTAPSAFAEMPQRESPSPDGKWLFAWRCGDPPARHACNIALSVRAEGKVFFTHDTSPRHIKAVWSSDSSRCVLLDAPDDANSYLWLFRVNGREVVTEILDYEKISADIEPPCLRHADTSRM